MSARQKIALLLSGDLRKVARKAQAAHRAIGFVISDLERHNWPTGDAGAARELVADVVEELTGRRPGGS